MISILAGIGDLNVGYIDWEDSLPTMYARFQRGFKLPVFYKNYGHPHRRNIARTGALWIVHTLVRMFHELVDRRKCSKRIPN